MEEVEKVNTSMIMEIEHFSPDGIDEVAKMAALSWGGEQGALSPECSRVFTGHLARYSFYSSGLSLQASDENGIQAIAFACDPEEKNDAHEWLLSQLPSLSPEDQHVVLTNEAYLTRIDAIIKEKMLPGSAKLSFFISRKPGCGTPLLERLIELLRERGYEWLYLWSDTSCNWQYYPKHGYEQIGEGAVPEFSTEESEYRYFLFRTRIS